MKIRHIIKEHAKNAIFLLDSSGAVVVQYDYDAWGNCKVCNANGTEITDANHIGNLNPFRYRSYYFDTETKFYFLQSRYYDPEIGRFLTIDDISYLNAESVNGLNLYAYCNNNPVMYADYDGHFAIGAFLIGLAISSLVGWVAGEIFGQQLVGGISSVVNGGTAIATGISLFAFGPVGWIIGGVAIVAGITSLAFGTAEIQEHFTGDNWIKNSFGWDDSLYNGLYIATGILSGVASIVGGLYRNSKISYGTAKAPKTSQTPYSRYYKMENNQISSITQYGNGGNPKYRIDLIGEPHFIKQLQRYALPHVHPFGISNTGYVFKKNVDIINYWVWLLLGNWR